MAYKTILVCLTTEVNAERLTKAACLLARKFDAHIIGLHTMQAMQTHPGVAVYLSPEAIKMFTEAQSRQAEKIREIFLRESGEADIAGEWKLVNADSDSAGDRLVEHARFADLVVMSQADPETDRSDQADIHREVIEGCGCPVLVMPIAGTFTSIGKKVMIGWSATREAARALHDAVPFMEDGGEATIMWVAHARKGSKHLSQTADAVAVSLGRHNVKTTVSHWQNTDLAIGDALLNEAYESGSDLIVSGAFGHSRFYDFVIGATTTHLLEHMTLPVLFSH
jgi:nucleotide-binding universal stress UspA family protein